MTYNYWDRYDQHEHVRPADMLDDAQAERMREFIGSSLFCVGGLHNRWVSWFGGLANRVVRGDARH